VHSCVLLSVLHFHFERKLLFVSMKQCLVTVDNMPNVLWIWDIPKLKLAAVLIQLSPIRSELTA